MSCFRHIAANTLVYLAAGLMLLQPLPAPCCCAGADQGCSKAQKPQRAVRGEGCCGRRARACCARTRGDARSCFQQTPPTPGQNCCGCCTCLCTCQATPAVATAVRLKEHQQTDGRPTRVSPAVSLRTEQIGVPRRRLADDWVPTFVSAADRCVLLCRFLL